jgi:hypothetical protein
VKNFTLAGPRAVVTIAVIVAACGAKHPQWIEYAGPIQEGQVEGIDNSPVAGAVTAILAHPMDANKLYVGTTNGGVWRTETATDGFPRWTPLMDGLPSLSIGALAFDPFDDKLVTIYAGTGRFSAGGPGGPHLGIYRTEDDGATWTIIGARLAGLRIRELVAPRVPSTVPDEPILLAATDSGVFRSTDAGANFTNVLPGVVTSLVGDPIDSTVVWAAIPQTGVFRSADAGATWTATSTIQDPFMASTNRVELAITRVPYTTGSPLVVYAAIASGSHAYVYRTEDVGASWIFMGSPTTQEAVNFGAVAGLFPGQQSNTHFSLAVDPTHPRRVYIGGDRQPRVGLIATASGTKDWSGRLFTGYAVTPPGLTDWQPLVGFNASNTSPHADSRFITFDALGNLLEGDDGGIYRLLYPAEEKLRLWQSLNGTLRPTELYSAAWDAHNNNVIAGTQDVGSIEQITQPVPGTLAQWRDARLIGFFSVDLVNQEGDGGTVAVDSRSKPGVGIRYTMGNHLGVFFRRDYAVPTPAVVPEWLRFVDANGPPGPFGGLHPADTVLQRGFTVIPFVLNTIMPERLVLGGNALYESLDFGFSVSVIDPPRQSQRIAALAYGGRTADGRNQPGAVYASRGNELSLRDEIGMNWTRRFISGASFRSGGAVAIRDIAIDPDDFRTAYLVTRDSVFRIDGAGDSTETVTNITGTLATYSAWYNTLSNGTSTLNLRTIEVFRVPGREAALLVGGLGGVFRLLYPDNATAAATPIWREFGRGLPNVVVTDLRFDATDDLLVAATSGRGAWVLHDAAAMLMVPKYQSLPKSERIPST